MKNFCLRCGRPISPGRAYCAGCGWPAQPVPLHDVVEMVGSFYDDQLITPEAAGEILAEESGLSRTRALLLLAEREQVKLRRLTHNDGWTPLNEWDGRWSA